MAILVHKGVITRDTKDDAKSDGDSGDGVHEILVGYNELMNLLFEIEVRIEYYYNMFDLLKNESSTDFENLYKCRRIIEGYNQRYNSILQTREEYLFIVRRYYNVNKREV